MLTLRLVKETAAEEVSIPPLTTTNSIIIIQSAAALFLLPMCILFHVPHLYCEHTRNEHKLFTFLSFVYFCQNFPFFSFSTT